MDGGLEGRMDGWLDGGLVGLLDRRKDGWVEGCTDRSVDKSMVAHLHGICASFYSYLKHDTTRRSCILPSAS